MSDPSRGIRCMWMRGGTSKGGYFLKDDLPRNRSERDALLLSIMGSPDTRQIDGMGGADPLTSKVALVARSVKPGIDVDYLFLQIAVDKPAVSDSQNCGNILAGVGPFAIERGLVEPGGEFTPVRIFMVNSSQVAIAKVATPGGRVSYAGKSRIDGVPGTSSAIPLEFMDMEGSVCGKMLPSGNVRDTVSGVSVTLIDNGMPSVILQARELGVEGTESPAGLEANQDLKSRLEDIRLLCGEPMKLGNVRDKTIPKMVIASPAQKGGVISTRTFTPHRCHSSIGVFGALTVASACLLEGSTAHSPGSLPSGPEKAMRVEHPSGQTTVIATTDDSGKMSRAAILRTANKLMDGHVFASQSIRKQ